MKIIIKENKVLGYNEETNEVVHEINLYQNASWTTESKGEWKINWSAIGSVSINVANDFKQVLEAAIKECARLNNINK